MSEAYHFQVNLGGMLDVLSNHLYKSPDVFLRELLQNGVDAVTLRRKRDPAFRGGEIVISLTEGKRLVFRDNGAGLSEPEIHRFLAVIGQSSKTELQNGKIPEDYIGRFGIGLLSCFMVSDSIVVHTKPAAGGGAHVWRGLPDGTYTLKPLEDCAVGTAVILEAKPGAEGYYTYQKIEQLVRYYGLALPIPVRFSGEKEKLNAIPEDFTQTSRGQLLDFGAWLFQKDFLDAVPIHTAHLNGVAYILPYETAATVKGGHRIYLKQMLLTERGERLLPPWAFFLRCFLNTKGLRPTASREDFYEDEALEEARGEFSDALSRHLRRLALENPGLLQKLILVHAKAIKAISVWDDDLFRIFWDYLPFETSEGELTGAALRRAGNCSYTDTVDQFKQLKPIFLSQGKLLICAGYVSDRELLDKAQDLLELPVLPLREDDMETVLEEPSWPERQKGGPLVRAANEALREFDCRAELKRFLPAELPVLYTMSDDVRFLREVKSAQDMSSGVFSDAMASLLSGVTDQPLATLYFNLNCPLIERLCALSEPGLLESVARILYIQAMLVGGHPLRGQELQVMSGELLALIDWRGRNGV